MPIISLDKVYTCAEPIGAYLAVVAGDTPRTCRLPTSPWDSTLLGVSLHSNTREGGRAEIRKFGLANCIAGGAITYGDPVCVIGGGRVTSISNIDKDPAYPHHVECLGFAETSANNNEVVEVFISIHQRRVW